MVVGKRWIRANTTSRIVLVQRDRIVHDNCTQHQQALDKEQSFCMRIIRSNLGLAKITDDDDGTRKVERRNDAMMVEKASAMIGGGISGAARLLTGGGFGKVKNQAGDDDSRDCGNGSVSTEYGLELVWEKGDVQQWMVSGSANAQQTQVTTGEAGG